MVAVPLAAQVQKREILRLPYARLTNMLVERDEGNQIDGLVRFQRPALAPFRLLPEGPNRGISRVDDAFSGAWFVVNGDSAYTVDFSGGSHTDIGNVGDGPGLCQIVIGRNRVLFIDEGIVYSWDGGTFTTVPIPDDMLIASGCFINGYFILAVRGSDRFYWIAPGEISPDPLSYATAERKADNLLGTFTLGDELWLAGGDGIEVWFPTTDPDAPFQRANSRVYEKGIVTRDCMTFSDSTLYAIGSDRVIYRYSPQPVRISTNAIEEHLRAADDSVMKLWSFDHTGHEILVAWLGNSGTWAFDISTGIWSQFTSYYDQPWRAHVGFSSEVFTLCGDRFTGQLWVLDASRSKDGDDFLVREVTGGVEVLGLPVRCDSFSVKVAAGWSPSPTLEPQIAVRFSDDQGATWSDWEFMSLGKMGEYSGEPSLRQLGLIEAPGRLFWLRMTDDAIFRINYARMNEAWGS